MAAKNEDPLEPIKVGVTTLRDILRELVNMALKKIKPLMRTILRFLTRLKSQAQALIGAIGKAAYNQIIALADRLARQFPLIEKLANTALKCANQILAMIKKATNPAKVINPVKRLVARLISMFRVIFNFVKQLLEALDPIGRIVGIICTFVNVLRLVISWITDVTGVNKAIKTVQTTLKRIQKGLSKGLKEATKLAKASGKLKPA